MHGLVDLYFSSVVGVTIPVAHYRLSLSIFKQRKDLGMNVKKLTMACPKHKALRFDMESSL